MKIALVLVGGVECGIACFNNSPEQEIFRVGWMGAR